MNRKFPDEVKVALVTAACVLGIAFVFKNVLHAQADFLTSHAPPYLFIVYIITRKKAWKSTLDNPLYWSLAIILVSVLIVLLNVI